MPQFVLLIPPLLVDHIGGSKRCKYVTISNENGMSPEIIGIGIQNGNSSSSETVCSVVHCYWLWFYLYRSGSASPFFCIYFFCIFCTSSGIKLLGFGSLSTSLGYYPWSNLQNMINFVDPSNKYILIYLIKQETLQTEDRKVRNTSPITQISRVGQGCTILRSWLIFMA